MKKITILLSLVLLTLLPACNRKEIKPYHSDHGVYFPDGAEKYKYSFIRDAESTAAGEHTIFVDVQVQGFPVKYDRKFKVSVVPREPNSLDEEQPTNAVVDIDYVPLESEYTMKAGDYIAKVPIIVKKTAKLDNEFIWLTLRLDSTDDLVIGLKEQQRSRVEFGNKLFEPEYWQKELWGVWSAKKQTTIEEVMGARLPHLNMIFPVTNEEYLASDIYPIRQWIADEMNIWFQQNPTYDENGDRITIKKG